MGAFVLGVLVGWIAEWLFYTFWVKAGDNNEDCSAIKAELELKNRQITSLQAQLASAASVTDKQQSSPSNNAVKTKSSNNASDAASTSSSTASAVNKKTTPKSKTVTKSAVKKAQPKTKRKSKVEGDDFTKLSGIGPSMSATLKTLGIDTFTKLANTDDDVLREMLESSDAKMNNNKEVMDSWNEQATLAAKGEFKALKTMQAALKK